MGTHYGYRLLDSSDRNLGLRGPLWLYRTERRTIRISIGLFAYALFICEK